MREGLGAALGAGGSHARLLLLIYMTSCMTSYRYIHTLPASLAVCPGALVHAPQQTPTPTTSTSAGGRDAVTLPPLVLHVARHVVDPRYATLLGRVGHLLLDIYGGGVGAWEGVDAALSTLRDRLASEVAVQQRLMGLVGMIEPLLAAGAR